MDVANVFHPGDGRTVFVGDVVAGTGRIEKMNCTLLVDGDVRDRFEIEGEMYFTPSDTTQRAVSVRKPVPISSTDVKAMTCVLEGLSGT